MQLTCRETVSAGPVCRYAAAVVFTAFTFAVLTVAGCGNAFARQVESSAGNFYEDALVRYNRGDFSGAVIQLKNALQENPANLPARILVGRTYLKLGDALSAEKELRRARLEGADDELLIVPLASAMFLLKRHREVLKDIGVEKRGQDVEAGLRIVRGQSYLALLKLQDAETEFERAAALKPSAAMPMIGLARIYMTRGQLRTARELIEKALVAEPDNFYVWFVNGQIARRLGNIDGALESFDKALALGPSHSPARIARARLLVESGRAAAARGDLDILSKTLPNNPFTAYIEALVKAEAKDQKGYQQALSKTDALLRGMERDALFHDPSLLLLAGVVNYMLKNYNDAHNFLREHIVRDRFHAGSRMLLGRLLLRRGSTGDALTTLRISADLAPNSPDVHRYIGIALMRLGRNDEAAAAFSKALELKPDSGSLRTVLALSQLRRGKPEEAISGLESALESDSDSIEPRMMLGLLLVRERKYDEALRVLGAVAAREPKNPALYNLMASALWANGDTATARQHLEKAIALNPGYLAAHRNLARMDLKGGDVAAAKARLRSMIEMPGASERPLVDLARIAEGEGDLREAISLLTKAREKSPEIIPIQLDLVELLARSGDGDAALRNIRKLDNKLSDNQAVIQKLGRIELLFGKQEDAAKAFRRLSESILDNADQYLQVARLQIRAADLDGAHGTLKRALVSNAEHLAVLDEIVNLEARLGLFDDALLRTRLIVKWFPGRANGYRLRGDVLARMRKFEDAASAYADAIEKEPSGDLLVRNYLARRAAGVERPPLKALEAWVAANADDYTTRRGLAAAYLHAGMTSEAQSLYEALVALQPDDPVVLNNLAWIYLEANDPRVRATAEKAYRLAPKQAQILDTFGWVLVETGDTARGLELLRDAFARASRRPALRYHLAVALMRQGQTEEARMHLEAVSEAENVSAEIAEKSRALLATMKGG